LKKINKESVDFLEMNQKNELLKNKNIRKSIQLSINKDILVSKVEDGSFKTNGILPMSRHSRVLERSNPNIEQSKLLLQKGCVEESDNCSIELDLITYNIPHYVLIADQIKKQLEEIGIIVNLAKYDIDKKSELDTKGKYDLSVAGWSSYYFQPIDNLKLWYSKDSRNISGFKNKNYDLLIEKAELEINSQKRKKLIQDAEQLLVQEEAAVVPLLNRSDLRLQKSYVKNVLYHPFGADYTLKWATYQPPKKIAATK
jgi:oligopeptide transport system substrate-binding protein